MNYDPLELQKENKRRSVPNIVSAGEFLVDRFVPLISMDIRSLALYRFLLGLVLMADVLDRCSDLRAHYTDEGYIPRTSVIKNYWMTNYVSIHMMNGSAVFALLMFAFQFVFAFLLAIGYKTRIMALLSWYWQLSLQIRTPIVLHNGDVYIRMLMFWAIFMPLDKFWSVDRMRSNKSLSERKEADSESHLRFNGGILGHIWQIFFVYSIAVVHKYQLGYKIWFTEGSATYWALNSLPYYHTAMGAFAAGLPEGLLQWLTWAVLYWEAFGWFCFFVPWKNHLWRLLGVAGFVALHAGFGACMHLEQFVWVGCTATVCYLPSWVWDEFVPAVRRYRKSSSLKNYRLVYHPSCEMLARFVESFCVIANIEFVRAPDDSEPQELLRFSCREGGVDQIDVNAIAAAIRASPVLWPLGVLFRLSWLCLLVEFVLEFYTSDVYFEELLMGTRGFERKITRTQHDAFDIERAHSRERSSGGNNGHHARSSKQRAFPQNKSLTQQLLFVWSQIPKRVLVLNALAVFFCILCILWNFTNVGWATFPSTFSPIVWTTMLFQSWHMFSPPPTTIYYHNLELNLDNGTQGELIGAHGLFDWKMGPLTGQPPYPLYPNYGNHRNWKFWESYNWHPSSNDIRLDFGRWICREWNSRHTGGEVLKSHATHYYFHAVPRNGQVPKISKQTLWTHNCF